jgi:hypothetical protein
MTQTMYVHVNKWIIKKKKRLKTELPFDPEIPLLGLYSKQMKSLGQGCTPMFTATLFTIPKKWKQLQCTSTEKWEIYI